MLKNLEEFSAVSDFNSLSSSEKKTEDISKLFSPTTMSSVSLPVHVLKVATSQGNFRKFQSDSEIILNSMTAPTTKPLSAFVVSSGAVPRASLTLLCLAHDLMMQLHLGATLRARVLCFLHWVPSVTTYIHLPQIPP